MKLSLRAALAATFVMTAAGVSAGYAQEKTYKIDQIIITGNKAVSTDALMAKVSFHHGEKVPVSQVAADGNAILSVYDSQNAVSVKISANLIPDKALTAYNAVFTLTETAAQASVTKVAPKLRAEIFDGNVKLTSDELAAASGLKPGDDLSNDKITAAQKAIWTYYNTTKKIGASISGENHKNDDGTSYDVTWHIKEGGTPQAKDDKKDSDN